MSVEGLGSYGFHPQTLPAFLQDPPKPPPTMGPTAPPDPAPPPPPDQKAVDAAADRVMNAGVRDFIKDNYEQRMDKFAEEMSKGDSAFRAALLDKILDKDPDAFNSWLHADRMPDKKINLDLNVGTTPNRVNFGLDDTFTTVDGKTIKLGDAVRERLNNLDKDPVDETDNANSDADHWESYSDRMGTIFHIFSNEQRNPNLQIDPRDAFGSRATALNNNPSHDMG